MKTKFSNMTRRQKLQFVASERLSHYESGELERQTAALVSAWRKAYPQAADEVSFSRPVIRQDAYVKQIEHDPDEIWFNDIYHVTVRRHKKDPVFDSKGGMVQLGINSHDGSSRHDWRDFQAIKNQLAGKECEGFELYPAESRLLDPSNYYSIWCFPSINKIKVGADEGRDVRVAEEAMAPQRSFAIDCKMKEMLEFIQNTSKLAKAIELYKEHYRSKFQSSNYQHYPDWDGQDEL